MFKEGKNKGVFCKHEITLSPEGIAESSEVAKANISWIAVEKIDLTDKYIFIYTSAASTIVVPKRAFSDESKYREFFETAKRYREGVITK
ncbi:MAG: YcxB family protein [Candidatus Omnitrophica bacterium]|nr:YcxB family protein [Candidatus Omnitrophota bacterium]